VSEQVLAMFRGHGQDRDTTGSSPGTEGVVFDASAEHL
jgi:hypothetical protein